MSKDIVGNLNLNKEIEIFGKEAEIENIPVKSLNARANRDTKAKVIQKYLKKGWDWALYDFVTVARMKCRGDQYLLLDGDHRRHMYMRAFPNRTTIPARVVDVETEEDYHRLFQDLNKDKRKSMTQEEAFVHKVLEGQPAAIKICKQLEKCGLKIHASSDPDGEVGDLTGPSVRLVGFKKCISISPLGTRWAAKLLKDNWPTDKAVSVELLGGLAIFYTIYSNHLLSDKSQIPSDFSVWWKTQKNYDQKSRATSLKNAGGNEHALAEASIAKGILCEYLGYQGSVSVKYKTRKLKRKDIKVPFGKNEDDKKEWDRIKKANKAIADLCDSGAHDIDW